MEQHTKRLLNCVVKYGQPLSSKAASIWQQMDLYPVSMACTSLLWPVHIWMRKARTASQVRLLYNAPALLHSCYDDSWKITKNKEVIMPSHASLISSIQPRSKGYAISLKTHRSLLKSRQVNNYWKSEIPEILEIFKILKSRRMICLVIALSSESVEYRLIYTLLWLKRSYHCTFCTSRVHHKVRKAKMISKCRHNFWIKCCRRNPHVSLVKHAKRSLMAPCFQPINEVRSS